MNAFFAYSVDRNKQHIVISFSNILRKQNFSVLTNASLKLQNILDFVTVDLINRCHIFFGLVTNEGPNNNQVFLAWDYAKKRRMPNLLLVDSHLNISHLNIPDHAQNVIKFDPVHPHSAYDYVETRIARYKHYNDPNVSENSNAIAWIIGGTAVLMLLSALADDK